MTTRHTHGTVIGSTCAAVSARSRQSTAGSTLAGAVAALLALGLAGCAGSKMNVGSAGDGGARRDATAPSGPRDECGNGMDDDGDGRVDDGCPCGPGEVQACFGGAYPNRRVGVCRDGTQVCAVAVGREWGDWGDFPCTGDVRPAAETCNGLDDDCDGASDEMCPCTAGQTQACGVEFVTAPCRGGTMTCRSDGTWSGCDGAVGPSADVCGDAIDNDCDGTADETCSCTPVSEVCRNGIDDDCDGVVDEPACMPDWPLDAGVGADAGPTPDGGIPTGGVVDIQGNSFGFCARYADGRVFCWGSNGFGALGTGASTLAFSATPVSPIDGARELAVGADASACVLRDDGIRCWGRTPGAYLDSGGYHGVEWSPVLPALAVGVAAADVAELEVGLDQYMFRRPDGTIWGWGYDTEGALGDGPTIAAGLARVATIDDALTFDAYMRSVCAVRSDHSVWCWGDAEEGQCGPPGGTGFKVYAPVQIAGVTDAVDVQVGASTACALRATGEVACWGMSGTRGDGASFTGDASFTTSAAAVPGLTDVVALESGVYATCAIKRGGELWCWGAFNLWDAPAYHTPTRITGLGEVVDVAVGNLVGDALGSFVGAMCVLERSGLVRCWGENSRGTNGDGTTTASRTPVDVVGLP